MRVGMLLLVHVCGVVNSTLQSGKSLVHFFQLGIVYFLNLFSLA
jgi:hypothetical protein